MAQRKENEDTIHGFGEILVEEGLITESQLRDTLKVQNHLDTYKPIGQILVDQS